MGQGSCLIVSSFDFETSNRASLMQRSCVGNISTGSFLSPFRFNQVLKRMPLKNKINILHCKSSLHPQPDPGHFVANAEAYDLVFFFLLFFLFYREKEDRAMPKYPGRHNTANFGKYGHCYCICEKPGQAPCPSRVPHPDAKKPKWWQQRGEAAQ